MKTKDPACAWTGSVSSTVDCPGGMIVSAYGALPCPNTIIAVSHEVNGGTTTNGEYTGAVDIFTPHSSLFASQKVSGVGKERGGKLKLRFVFDHDNVAALEK